MDAQPNLIIRLLRARKAGQLIVIVVMAITAISTLSKPDSTPLPENEWGKEAPAILDTNPTSLPTDTVTISLTWDQWSDLQNAIWFITTEMTATLELADVPPSRIPQARATIQRFEQLNEHLLNEAENNSAHISSAQIQTILNRQTKRQEELIDLIIALEKARVNWITDTVYP